MDHPRCPRSRWPTWWPRSPPPPASARALFSALGLHAMLEDPRFATNDARVAHNNLVDQALQEAIGKRTLPEMVRLFERDDLTASPVYDIADISRDPHVVARRILIDMPDPTLGA